jgi:hypothetical protein
MDNYHVLLKAKQYWLKLTITLISWFAYVHKITIMVDLNSLLSRLVKKPHNS